ncbi:aminoglycoside phosphotransferase family protein [Virgibacillus halophilus]|uniref:aminoglycoside phosphotransferase family protein n=1 Tax=Tigheibacillus halophilus TaxID=361280 RepID=UPI0036277B5A
MDLKLAEAQVTGWAKKYSQILGLHKTNIKAIYIHNPGGFVNQSFRLSDGETSLHVKFADDRRAPHLKQWASLNEYLSKNHHSPRLIHEVAEEVLPGFRYGLVFEYINGKPLEDVAEPLPVVQEVFKSLKRIHSDTYIKKVLGMKEKTTLSEAFVAEYISRFEEDLLIIRSGRNLLDFVSDESLDWFYSELQALKQMVSQLHCFQRQAADVVHNDLNWQNILVNNQNHFWIIDWDDLTAAGDAAMDYTVLLWPFYRSEEWPAWKNKMALVLDKEMVERMSVYFRAKLLDDVIDVLADYVEAEGFPDVKEAAQLQAKETHLCAFQTYRERYGDSKNWDKPIG